ncbi:MAG TPA: Trk system potassium transporter TrkA [Mesorhizobium sp.]|jgi:trk system potassium uptake protein TrkA|nr:Trk system potassium transporter TrkA [Mesorhizobium sp.]
MRVIVCGAGRVGSSIARQLATEGIDVTVIDSSPEQARRVDESYDVRGMVGYASHPEVLERAGARNADMLIAVTRSDEVNMVACQVAYSLFGVKRRVARLRHSGYLEQRRRALYAADQLPIDVIISPEIEVAKGIERRLKVPGAFDTVPLADGRVQLLGIHCNTPSCSALEHTLAELPKLLPGGRLVVLAILRDGRAIVPSGRDRISLGDDIYIVAETERVGAIMRFFGHEEKVARRVVIVGGGNVGLNLAKRIVQFSPSTTLRIVEHSRERAEFVSQELGDRAVVLHGDALDVKTLDEANIRAAETIVAVTNDDETNIFASVLAKREGCARAITLVNKPNYEPFLPTLGIDVVVAPNAITISSILRHVRHRSVTALHALREDFGEVIEATAQEGSKLVSGDLGKVGLPPGMLIGAIVRGDEVIIPATETVVMPGDRVIAIVTYDDLRKGEALLVGPDAAGDKLDG